MAVVVEDGTGLTTANSYLSLADATTYLTSYATAANLASWTAATEAVKNNSLLLATQFLDCQYVGRWRGERANDTQALAWPRSYAEDDDGYDIDADSLPQKLEDACAELALRVVLGDSLLPVETEPGEVTSESITVGPISKSKDYAGGRPAAGYRYPKIDRMLHSLTVSGGRVYRA